MLMLLSAKARSRWLCFWVCLFLVLPLSSSLAERPRTTTTAATTNTTPTRLARTALDTSGRYLHVREVGGANRGPDVDAFNRTVGAPPASNWCMSYIYTMWSKAARALAVMNPLVRSGAVWRQVVHARRYGSGLHVMMAGHRFGTTNMEVLPGDIGIMSSVGTDEGLLGRQWTGHVYLVREDRGSTVASREGNTNNDGSRNGYRVANRVRQKSKTLCYLRHEGPTS